MKKKHSVLSPFLTFRAEEQEYLFDGGNGLLCKVDPIIIDILSLSPLYNILCEEEWEEIISILNGRYSTDELLAALKLIDRSNDNGFLAERGKIYNYFEEEYLNFNQESFKGNLWLSVTHNCNLKCSYCFEDSTEFKRENSDMTVEIARNCIDYWFSQINKEQRIFDIIFFGGEPLLNQEVIFFSVNYINQLLTELKGVPRYSITTNGTILNEKILNLMSDNIFFVNVSIDGLKRIHEENRPYKSGHSTYNTILENIKRLSSVVNELDAYVSLTSESIPYFKQSVLWLWQSGITNVYGNLVFGKNMLYDHNEFDEFRKQINELAEISFNNIINDQPFIYSPFIEAMKSIAVKKISSNCYFWQNSIFIFAPSGDAFKCHRFIGDSRYWLGGINDPELDLYKTQKKDTTIERCINCWYQLYCGDGCPYEHDLYNNDINVPSEQLCMKSKITFEESLKLYARLQHKAPEKLGILLGGRKVENKI